MKEHYRLLMFMCSIVSIHIQPYSWMKVDDVPTLVAALQVSIHIQPYSWMKAFVAVPHTCCVIVSIHIQPYSWMNGQI
jgi:hypothetical protein